ncbi:MAG TPA: flagellar basal body P-ring protein FlgI [Polyangia bacterium]|nr:flagellar basal body P-ring protein FlgI [Polyangia bacterium]
MKNTHRSKFVLLAAALVAFGAPRAAQAANVRVKELVDVQGMRDNALYGYGLVVGLAGTGDTENVFFTSQSISGMLGRLGIRIDPHDVRVRNVAAVMVTARLPAFARPGTHMDVNVASMGNARSLAGGVLLITPLTGADGLVYGLAQGPVQAGGIEAAAYGSSFQKNQPTSGRVPAGATIERAVTPSLEKETLTFGLKRPDFTTANNLVEAINKALGEEAAKAADPAQVIIKVPAAFKGKAVALVTKLETLEVAADERARVVVSERTGTVVAGERVRIHPVAVAHGGLSISIQATPVVFQPNAFSQGKTAQTKQAQIDAKEKEKPVVALPATTSVEDLTKALNLLGASPRDLIAILQAMKAAGALDADLEVL